jgi:large subunit ribosomal protein L27
VCTQKEKSVQLDYNISWLEIENEYVTDISRKPCSLEDLAKKYSIPIQTIMDQSAKGKWSDKRNPADSSKSGAEGYAGRDSAGRRLGAKVADGQTCNAGAVIYRQRGTKIHPGVNVGIGGDDTLFALVDGVLRFERKGRDKKQASVYPVESAE